MVKFENGTLVKGAYVVIDGVEYEVHMPEYSGKTPLSAENMNKIQNDILRAVFPVGSTYTTPTNTNPNSILGFGTWERLKGKMCVGLDEDDEDGYFNEIGKTGGEKKHKLSRTELPIDLSGVRCSTDGTDWSQQGATTHEGNAFNVTQPYEVTGYMWIRRA